MLLQFMLMRIQSRVETIYESFRCTVYTQHRKEQHMDVD